MEKNIRIIPKNEIGLIYEETVLMRILQRLNDKAGELEIFNGKADKDLNKLRDKILAYAKQYDCLYKVKEMMEYCSKNDIFQAYLDQDVNKFSDHWKWIDSQVRDFALTHVSQGGFSEDESSDFIVSMIFFAFLSNPNAIFTDIKRKILTYQWQTNPDQELPELYRRMIIGRLIDDKTDFDDFRAVFTGQPIQSITNKIKWLAEPTLLVYFIEQIRYKLPMITPFWSIAKVCFENAGNMAQLKQNYLNSKTGLPKQHKLIDDLLKDL